MQQFQWLAKHNENRKTVLQSSYLSTSVDATIPLRSADTELQRTIELQHTKELQHTTVEHIAWMQQFQCTKPLSTCKTQKHSINKEKKGSPGLEPSVPLRAQNEQESTTKPTPASVARAWANFSPQWKLRLPKKSFVQILTYNRIHDAAVPMRSAKNDLQNTIRIARQYCRAATFRPALTQPFHCGLQTLSCNTP